MWRLFALVLELNSQHCFSKGNHTMIKTLKFSQWLFTSLLLNFLIIFNSPAFAGYAIGQTVSPLILDGKDGGKVDGKAFNSKDLRDKPYLVFYVDPDEEKVNADLEQALKNEKFPEDKLGSVAIINMAATWLPNFAIATILKSKQDEFKDTIYVKDLTKAVVKQWQMADDSYSMMLLDKSGAILFKKDGKFNSERYCQV